jgi:hypothetical protein
MSIVGFDVLKRAAAMGDRDKLGNFTTSPDFAQFGETPTTCGRIDSTLSTDLTEVYDNETDRRNAPTFTTQPARQIRRRVPTAMSHLGHGVTLTVTRTTENNDLRQPTRGSTRDCC